MPGPAACSPGAPGPAGAVRPTRARGLPSVCVSVRRLPFGSQGHRRTGSGPSLMASS